MGIPFLSRPDRQAVFYYILLTNGSEINISHPFAQYKFLGFTGQIFGNAPNTTILGALKPAIFSRHHLVASCIAQPAPSTGSTKTQRFALFIIRLCHHSHFTNFWTSGQNLFIFRCWACSHHLGERRPCTIFNFQSGIRRHPNQVTAIKPATFI